MIVMFIQIMFSNIISVSDMCHEHDIHVTTLLVGNIHRQTDLATIFCQRQIISTKAERWAKDSLNFVYTPSVQQSKVLQLVRDQIYFCNAPPAKVVYWLG